MPRPHVRPSHLLLIATCLPALLPATGLAYEESLYIDGGRPVTATPDVRLTLEGPEEAEYALVSGDPGLQGAVRLPARGEASGRLRKSSELLWPRRSRQALGPSRSGYRGRRTLYSPGAVTNQRAVTNLGVRGSIR